MAIDTDTHGTPGWWLQTLAGKLHERKHGHGFTRSLVSSSTVRPGLLLLNDYLRGDPPLQPDVHGSWAGPFRQFVRMGRLNLAELVTLAPGNRLGIRDFRTSAADDELGDEKARELMKRNELKLKAREVHHDMLGLGDAYTIVTPPDAKRDWSLITAESPLQCITAHDAATGETLAGLKMFRDDWDSADFAYLFLPGELWVARMVGPTSLNRRRFTLGSKWDWDEDRFDDVPDDQVAMVRFRNRNGVGEFEHHLNQLDRINDKLFNEWWISKIQAFRQRALTIAESDADSIEEDAEAAEEDEPPAPDSRRSPSEVLLDPNATRDELMGLFTSAPDALWQLPAGAKIWESQNVDVTPLVNSIGKELEWLAAATQNPLHTITPDAADGSAEGASTMKEEHVYKIEDRRDRADGAWARTMGMAFLFQGDRERADVSRIECIWGPLERYSLDSRTQAASTLWGKLPTEMILTDLLQYSPQEVVDRYRPLAARELLQRAQAAAAAAAAAARATSTQGQ